MLSQRLLILKVEPIIGSHIDDICIQMSDLCQRLNLACVCCDFNGRSISAFGDGRGYIYSAGSELYEPWTIAKTCSHSGVATATEKVKS